MQHKRRTVKNEYIKSCYNKGGNNDVNLFDKKATGANIRKIREKIETLESER